MALLRTLAVKKGLSIKPVALYNAARQASYYIEDYMPQPYPKTEKERLEAAKKYGLLPHEYEPYPDDGLGKGDYPKLPDICADSKDPFYPWDYPEYRKNYGEVWHADQDILGEDRLDISVRRNFGRWTPHIAFFGVMGLLAFLTYITAPFPYHPPASAKQMPKDGRVHYSFERGHN